MVIIDEIVEDLEEMKKRIDINQNCFQVFNDSFVESEVDIDVYYSAKAFTSIVNSIINKKIDSANYIIDSQIELLNFLNTYDDKYLSNIQNLISTMVTTEISTVTELFIDISELLDFLEDFLNRLKDLKKNNNKPQKSLQQQLEEMLENFEKKYEGGEYEE